MQESFLNEHAICIKYVDQTYDFVTMFILFRRILNKEIYVGVLDMTARYAVIFKQPMLMPQFKQTTMIHI